MGKKSVSKKSTFEDVVFYNFFKPIYENKNFDVFKDTVDSEQEGCEDYYEKIKNPIDLDLIYQNCIEFNGIENEYIVPIAEQYKQYVEQQYKKVQNLINENLDWSIEDELLIDPRRIDIGKPILDEDELRRCKILRKSKNSFKDNQQMIKSQDQSLEQINQKQNKRRTTKRSTNKQNHNDSKQEIIEESKQQDTLQQSGKTKHKSSKNHHKKYNNKYGLSQDSHDIGEETYSTNNSKKNNTYSQKQSQQSHIKSQENSKKNSEADQKFVTKNLQQQQEEEQEEEEFLNYDLEEMIYNHLLKPIWNKKKFTIFQEPVKTDSPETENYYDLIKNPMCLEQIYDKLDKGEYKKLEQIIQDLYIIANNCTEFNGPENEYTAPLVQEFVNSVEKTLEKVKRMCDKRDIDIQGDLKAFNEFTLLTEEEKQKILEEEEKIKEEEKQKELQKLNQQIQNNVSNGNIIHSSSFEMGSEEFNSRRMTRKGSRKDSQVNLQQQNSNSHLNISNHEKQKQSDKKRRNPYKNEDLQQNQLEMEKNIPEKKIRIHETYSEVDIEDYSEVIDSMFLEEEEYEEEQEEQENEVQYQEKNNSKNQNQQQELELENQGSENQANQFNQIEKQNKDNIENENCQTNKDILNIKEDYTDEKEKKEINNNSYQNLEKNEKQVLIEQNIDQNHSQNDQEIQKINQQMQQNNDMQIQKQQDNDQENKSENQSLQSTKEQEVNGQFQQELMQLQ
ncbi:Bromodomain [Pseudocohnilembus persalinus]|uniref:Bromodomain n=1 Tax=Pseudocohnilembus persalinus TaxID=266149 RepID=A0A0V0QLY2_PSEPJ|nr:Bromodomain [Pseudocohnilembus persalinus]|eukprot:KRX03259.1 Bromodomain [Pseudocohnilembus persalinus]